MAQYGPSLQTAQITTGNMRTALDLYKASGVLNNGAQNPLGASYYDNAVSLGNPNGVWGKFRYVRYNSTSNPAVVAGPGVVYYTDSTGTTVSASSAESVSAGINAVAGVMMVNSTSIPGLTAAALNGNFVWICVAGFVAQAVVPATVAKDDTLIGGTTAWVPGRIAAGSPFTNTVLANALTAASGGLADIMVAVER